MSLNMVFTGEDRAAIKFMRHSKVYSAGRLVKEIPSKKSENWRFEQFLRKLMTLTVTLNILCLPVKYYKLIVTG